MQNLTTLNKSPNIRGALAEVTIEGNWKHVLRPIQAKEAPQSFATSKDFTSTL